MFGRSRGRTGKHLYDADQVKAPHAPEADAAVRPGQQAEISPPAWPVSETAVGLLRRLSGWGEIRMMACWRCYVALSYFTAVPKQSVASFSKEA
ncbi:hypothetical protein ACIO6T_30810 [Streptomyces sp. NPDC087532]|uniref:hypothetical protein n=1 Tax=Streptomyces sp. NPDC087532 TaxID=3365795 RepID=UPI0037FB9C1B